MSKRLAVTVRITTDPLTRYFALPLGLHDKGFPTIVTGPSIPLRLDMLEAHLRFLALTGASTSGVSVMYINQQAIRITVTGVGAWPTVEQALFAMLAEIYGRTPAKIMDISQVTHQIPTTGLRF